jgi:hypothetical protein
MPAWYTGGMRDPFNRLAHMMRTQPAVLLMLEQKMNALTGQEGVFEDIIRENDIIVDRTLASLGLTRKDSPMTVRHALAEQLGHLDRHLFELLGQPDLSQKDIAAKKLRTMLEKVFLPPRGLFLKKEKAAQMLEKYPPHNLLEHFGYANVGELLDKEGFAPVMASLRFTQPVHWMHQFFDIAYSDLKPEDFEERDVEFLVLDQKWLTVAGDFVEHKHHNVSHLKEFGIIFVVPIPLDTTGETMRMFTLILHYLHEVPFYSELFRHFMIGPNFAQNFKSLLRGDVSSDPLPNNGRISWRVVQRYLAKDNEDDFRLFEPHVNPEADHWSHAEEDLSRLSRILGKEHGTLDLGWWTGLDFVGELFVDPATGRQELVSLDLIDLLMTLVQKDSGTYLLYHQQEALWNKVFSEFMGRDQLEILIREHIIDGFIILGKIHV